MNADTLPVSAQRQAEQHVDTCDNDKPSEPSLPIRSSRDFEIDH
jgi:hypothetical protein